MLNKKRITEIKICFRDKIFNLLVKSSIITFMFILLLTGMFTDLYAEPSHKNKTVTFGGDCSFPPYEYLDNRNIPQGFCVDLTKAIAEESGWDVRILLLQKDETIKALNSGKIDIIQRALYNDEKIKIYSYSMAFHDSTAYIFINSSDSDYFHEHSTEGMDAVVQKNNYYFDYIRTNYPANPIRVNDTIYSVFSGISNGTGLFTVMDKNTGFYLMRASGITNVTAADGPLDIGQYHYVSLKKNDDLISSVNTCINNLRKNGKLKKIQDRWFGVFEKKSGDVSYQFIFFIIPITVIISFLIWRFIYKGKNKIELSGARDNTGKNMIPASTVIDPEGKTELILENTPIGIFQFDNNGIISNCNQSFVQIMNGLKQDITGYNMLTHHNRKIAELTAQALEGKSGYFEGDYHASGKMIYIRTIFVPVMISDGTINGGLGILENVTEQKEYEEALVAAKDTAESASNIKSHFLANMSHEVRTPLNGILGMLQLLQTTGINEEQSNYVSIAIKSGMRLTRLLNDILELSRVEADKLVLNETQFSLKNIFNFIEERYIAECDEKGVKLQLIIDENTPEEIVGDEIRIRQILINIVSNSVKYTKTGQINISIRAEDISLYGAVNIIISVRDTGIGIAPDMLNRIFEPFKQGEDLYRRSFQGAGLGLTLVKHLVNIMNGSIKIDSTPGKGTSVECTITVKLPENQSIDIKPLPSEKPDKAESQMTILVAEDERINRLALKRILEKLGYRILEAENGIEVLKILETENPGCILMDIQMPEMDGIETTKLLRNREKYGNKSDIPVIALTAYTLPEDREKIKAAGLDDFISKPVNMDYLVKSISRFVVNT